MRYSRLNPISKFGALIVVASIFFPWASITTTNLLGATYTTNMSLYSLFQYANQGIISTMMMGELQSIITFTFIALIASCGLVFFNRFGYGIAAGLLGILYFTVSSGLNFEGLLLILNLEGLISGLNFKGPLSGYIPQLGFYTTWIGVILMGIGIIPWHPRYKPKRQYRQYFTP